MELIAPLDIGRHKSVRLGWNLIKESIDQVNATLGVLIRKRFQLINLGLDVVSLERDNNIT